MLISYQSITEIIHFSSTSTLEDLLPFHNHQPQVPVRRQIWPPAAIFDFHHYHISETTGEISPKPCMCPPENDSGLSTNMAEQRPSLKSLFALYTTLQQSRYHIFSEVTGRIFSKCSHSGLAVHTRKWPPADTLIFTVIASPPKPLEKFC